MIPAVLDYDHKVFFAAQHGIDGDRVADLVAAFHAAGGEWIFPPVLVIESEGNGDTVIDGHHRLAAAKDLGVQHVAAWVVSVPDYCRLIDAEFGGDTPIRLADLWEHIDCDGKTYAELQDELESA